MANRKLFREALRNNWVQLLFATENTHYIQEAYITVLCRQDNHFPEQM